MYTDNIKANLHSSEIDNLNPFIIVFKLRAWISEKWNWSLGIVAIIYPFWELRNHGSISLYHDLKKIVIVKGREGEWIRTPQQQAHSRVWCGSMDRVNRRDEKWSRLEDIKIMLYFHWNRQSGNKYFYKQYLTLNYPFVNTL